MQRRRSRSGAKQVDDAWKRCLKRRERFAFLPMDPERLDWDDLRYTAADARSNLKQSDVQEHRADLLLVRRLLGRIPEVG